MQSGLDKQCNSGPGDAVITLVMPALMWLVAPGVVALKTIRCHQWRRGWRRGGSQNSMAY